MTVVSLGCAAGRVQWRYPQGALRVSLDPSNAYDFRACLRVENGSRGARVFIEAHRRLQLLWAEDDGGAADKWRCFASRGGSASLYLEAPAETADPLRRSAVTFEYDAQPTETSRLWDDMEGECAAGLGWYVVMSATCRCLGLSFGSGGGDADAERTGWLDMMKVIGV